MKILVTGANGMLGSSLCPELQRQGYSVLGTDLNSREDLIKSLDITDFAQTREILDGVKPDIIFHLAAETDLDLCEKDPGHAYRVNVQGTENIAKICQTKELLMIYISTSGVFDGNKKEPYIESDKPNPINVYGRTKLEGEQIVRRMLPKYFIIRASWMVGGGVRDKKFVGKIIKLVQDGTHEIKAVHDISGSPTFTDDFARNIMPMVLTGRYGIYHMANKGSCSRFELAKKVVEYLGKKQEVAVKSVSSNAFPMIAPRPRYEVLFNQQLDQLGLNNMPEWENSLKRYVLSILNDETF